MPLKSTSATEPFGLKFGSPRSANPYKVLRKIELRKKTKKLDAASRLCAGAVFEVQHVYAPKQWKINSDAIDGFEKVPRKAKSGYDMNDNKYGADFSIDGKVTAYIYNIKGMKFCVAYFENKLFLLYSRLGEWWDKWDIIRDRFEKLYGSPKTEYSDKRFRDKYTIHGWIDKKNKIYIEVSLVEIRGYDLGGHLLYTYAPIKSLQIREMMKKHIAKYYKESKKSGF